MNSVYFFNNTVVANATNNGTIISGNGYIAFTSAANIATLTNTGIISGSYVGFRNEDGNITYFNNSGTIEATGDSGLLNTGTITTLTNSGIISGPFGIHNTGIITTLNNLQGKANSPLSYTGTLPTNYNIIILSPTNYGQLRVSGASGTMAFGIYPGSIVAATTYTDVLQGFANLNNITGDSGTYAGYNYQLIFNGTNYDLSFVGLPTAGLPTDSIDAIKQIDKSPLLAAIIDDDLSQQGLITALNSIIPEPYADNQTTGLQFLRRQSDLLLGSAGDNCQDTKKNYCGFVLGGKNVATINGQNGLGSFNSAVVNTIYGVEWNPNKNWSLGLAYGYGTTNLSNYTLDAVNITGNVNSGSIYGVYKPNSQLKISALFDYSNFNYQGSRYININNPDYTASVASSNFGASGYSGVVKATYDIALATKSSPATLHIIPIAALGFNSINQNGFTETGAGVLNLNVASKTSQSLIGTIGATIALPVPINNHGGTITPSLTASYNVDFLAGNDNNYSVNSSFPAFPDAGTISYLGQNGGTNFLNLTATVDVTLSPDVNFYVTGNYEASNVGSSYSYSGGLRVKF